MGNKIAKRWFYEIDVTLDSPLNLSNGEDYYTDSDVMTNGDGEYVVPGTSIAGAFRNYLTDLGVGDVDSIFGYSKGEEGRMSPLFISDMVLGNDNGKLGIRDFVALSEDKIVENKFDAQILEPGVSGTIRMEYVQREDMHDINTEIDRIISGIAFGDIRFGGNKNRGFGRFRVGNIRRKCFAKKDDLLGFLKNPVFEKDDEQGFEEWEKSYEGDKHSYIKVQVPLKLTGGISIRRYSAVPGRPDYEHITSNGKPIIPGTSWNGAIRSDVGRILKDFGMKDAERVITEWFGNAKKDEAKQSAIVFSESVIENSEPVPMTRNQIDRFSGGTREGALYAEVSCFGGTTVLEYLVRKDGKFTNALLKVMELAVEDIVNGYIAIGGQTAIGRGIFTKGEGKVTCSEDISEKKMMKELNYIINGGRSNEND